MNNPLATSRVLGLLDQLKEAARQLSEGRESSSSEFKARSAAETRAFERASAEGHQRLAERLAEAEARAAEDRDRLQARMERRRAGINDAHKRLRRKATEDVTEFEGSRKQKLQSAAMEAERKRDADLASAALAHDDFKAKLVESEHAFAELEHRGSRVFRGFGGFRRLLAAGRPLSEPDLSPDETRLLDGIHALRKNCENRLARFRWKPAPALLRALPIWLLALIVIIGAAVAPTVAGHFGRVVTYAQAGVAAGAGLAACVLLYLLARAQASGDARAMAADLLAARRLHESCFLKNDARSQAEQERIRAEFRDTSAGIDQQYRDVIKEAMHLRDLRPRQLDEKAKRAFQRHEVLARIHAERQAAESASNLERVRAEAEAAHRALEAEHAERMKKFAEDRDARGAALERVWNQNAAPVLKELENLEETAKVLFPEWELEKWRDWRPPDHFQNAAKFGQLEIDVAQFAGVAITDERIPARLSAPLALAFPEEGSLLLETGKSGAEEAIATINDVIFRLLAATPPGKLNFTILDPVGLGQNFAGLMHLADYEQSHIKSRIWTQTGQIEEKLGELNEHMEKIIQMYLRNEYATIAEYNEQAGAVAEKYHVLVIASFPAAFSDTAAKRLRNIAASGARCGVYTLIHWDKRQPAPQDFVPDELLKNSVRLVFGEKGFEFGGRPLPGTRMKLEAPPSPEFATSFLHRVGEFSKDANRVEVPFEEIAPPGSEMWTEDTSEELRVPIGRSGATRLQYLAIGKGTRQHALIAGKTGSGKSTLFHVIVTNLALWCSPEEVEFYLVDFKKGVEFKCYGTRRLPHARVVAIESDRQFGLSVLERVDAELRRRGDLFRKLGVQDIPGYKRAGGKEPMPRSLLMIDEFQEFFTEEDRVSQSAAVLLDRIVRQGRAFGIHVLLGSQTLGGAYTLARATLGQMVIRIALQCNEADAYLIMDQDNPAPRLLSRPGEGIYNDAAGAIEGNSPFQAVWLPEKTRDAALERVRARADAAGKDFPGPFVFEGNAPADIRENQPLARALATEPLAAPQAYRIWLGAPNSIKGPTEAAFTRQGGNNLMIVGQNEEPTLAILSVALISLAAQLGHGPGRIILLESAVPGSPQAEFLEQVIHAVPREISRPKGSSGLNEAMAALDAELKKRAGGAEEESGEAQAGVAPIFLIIHGLETFKRLRQEDEFAFSSGEAAEGPNPASVLQSLIVEGPSHGIHLVVTCDSFNNVSRFLGRKALSEFSIRVLFQMSASDSAALIDAPDAGTLGLHRALLYNDREGYMELFRPYARPGNDWFEVAGAELRKHAAAGAARSEDQNALR